jgi:hypothetical protein
VIYRATEFNQFNPTEDEKRGINWLIRCEGEEFRRDHNVGDVFSFEITDVLVGKTIEEDKRVTLMTEYLFLSRVSISTPIFLISLDCPRNYK